MVPHIDPLTSSPTPLGPRTTPPTPKLPISLCVGIWSTRNSNTLYACTLHYHRLSASYFSFVFYLDFVSIHKSRGEAMADLR